MTAENLKVGVIGAGFIAQTLHLPALEKHPEVRIASIYDSDEDILTDVAARFAVSHCTTRLEDLLDDPEINGLVISLPRKAMPAMVYRAVQSGKHIFAEKPVAYTIDDMARIKDSKSSGQIVQAGYMKRFDPAYMKFRELLNTYRRTGEFGKIINISVDNFCGKYYATPPSHLKRKTSRTKRFEEWASCPKRLPDRYASQYDFMVNVSGHTFDLLIDLFGKVPAPVDLHVNETALSQTVILEVDGCFINVMSANSAIGKWHEVIDVFYENALLRLELASPFAPSGSGQVTLESEPERLVIKQPPGESETAFDNQMNSFISSAMKKSHCANVENRFTQLVDHAQLMETLWGKYLRV